MTDALADEASGISPGYHCRFAWTGRRAISSYAALGITGLLIAMCVVALSRGSSPSVVAVGTNPIAIAITPDGMTAYVVNMADNTVTPVNLAAGRGGPPITVNGNIGTSLGGPNAIAIVPDCATAYVSGRATGSAAGTLTPISVAHGMTGRPIPINGDPGPIAITPDGATAYVVTSENAVLPVALATRQPGKPIPVSGAAAIAITPDGSTAYVTSFTPATSPFHM